jgi:hypothetical protein
VVETIKNGVLYDSFTSFSWITSLVGLSNKYGMTSTDFFSDLKTVI